MNQFSRSLLCCLVGACIALPAMADAELDKVQSALTKKYPATKFGALAKTPVAGIYQVVMGKNVAYVDPTGRYFLFGSLFDMQTQQDLTASVRVEANKVEYSKLPKSDAIKIVMGNGGTKGQREFALFSDPDCPYCKRLEQTLAGMTDYTVYVFPFPIASLHPTAPETATSIWCAGNQAQAWRDYLINGKRPANKTCKNPIDNNVKLAGTLGINGTPTMIHRDGRKTAGAMDKAALEKWLEGKK